MCVHDLDLVRWFTGSDIKNVWGLGGVFEFDLYRELNDADNAAAMVQCDNGAMGFLFTNRTHAAGCNVETEIIGTRGTLRIAPVGARDLLQIVDEHGARRSITRISCPAGTPPSWRRCRLSPTTSATAPIRRT